MTLIHHPDGYMVTPEGIVPLAEFLMMEPGYAGLPPGYIGREFAPGVKNHIILPDGTQHQEDINDATLTGYHGRAAEYMAGLAAIRAGANVFNQAGAIVIQGPPTISVDKASIPAAVDGLNPTASEKATVTVNVGSAGYAGNVTWTVKDGNGSVVHSETEAMVAGAATLVFSSNAPGVFSVEAVTADYGRAVIGVAVV